MKGVRNPYPSSPNKAETMEGRLSFEGHTLGLWRWNAPPSKPLGRLKLAYDAILAAVEQVKAKRQELDSSKKYTPAGVQDALRPFVLSHAVKPLRRALREAANIRAAAEEERSALRLVEPLAKDDIVGELRRQEMRTFLRSLPDTKRNSADLLHLGRQFLDAVLDAPRELSGLKDVTYKFLADHLMAERNPEALALIGEVEEASDLVKRAHDIGRAALQTAVGIPMVREFKAFVAPAEEEVDEEIDREAKKGATPLRDAQVRAKDARDIMAALDHNTRSKLIDEMIELQFKTARSSAVEEAQEKINAILWPEPKSDAAAA